MSATGTERARRRRKTDYYKWAAGIAVPVLVAVIGLFKFESGGKDKTPGNFTYVGSLSIIHNEIPQYLGGPLKDEAVRAQLEAAVNLMRAGQYEASRPIFEQLATSLPVPAILTAAGTLNAERGNTQAARRYFEQALTKNPEYKPALENLSVLKTVKVKERAVSGGHEVEPNNNTPVANILPVGTGAMGEIDETSDTDYFRCSIGPAPRDIYRISLKNLSTTLVPGVSIYDAKKNELPGGSYANTPGADVDHDFAPTPDSDYYLQVYQRHSTTGNYSLTVTPLRRFDRYEPNDNIRSPKAIGFGKTIEANIMDSVDTDYFEVKAGRTTVTVNLKNTSNTLVPGMAIFDAKKNELPGSPYPNTPGADVDHTFTAQEGGTYYVQIYPRHSTSGSYSLLVR
jgi:hypothetical protein